MIVFLHPLWLESILFFLLIFFFFFMLILQKNMPSTFIWFPAKLFPMQKDTNLGWIYSICTLTLNFYTYKVSLELLSATCEFWILEYRSEILFEEEATYLKTICFEILFGYPSQWTPSSLCNTNLNFQVLQKVPFGGVPVRI